MFSFIHAGNVFLHFSLKVFFDRKKNKYSDSLRTTGTVLNITVYLKCSLLIDKFLDGTYTGTTDRVIRLETLVEKDQLIFHFSHPSLYSVVFSCFYKIL